MSFVAVGCVETQVVEVEVIKTITIPVEVTKIETVEVPVERIVTKEVIVEKVVTQFVHQPTTLSDDVIALDVYIPEEVVRNKRIRRGRGPEFVNISLPEGEEYIVQLSLIPEHADAILEIGLNGETRLTLARTSSINFISTANGAASTMNSSVAIHDASGIVNIDLYTKSDWVLTFIRAS